MLHWLTKMFKARTSYPLSGLPEGYWPDREHRIDSPLSLSPFYAALRLFQTTVGSLPLVTYQDGEQGRERYKTHPAYTLLHSKPNPSTTRATFYECLIRDLYLKGEFFVHVIWTANNRPSMFLPVPHSAVAEVKRLDDWRKEYRIQTKQGMEIVPHEDMIHVMNFPDEQGLRGVSLEHFACEALGLHRQVQEAGTAFFKNAVRPANYVSFPNKVNDQAAQTLLDQIDARHKGPTNRGKTFYLADGGKLESVSDQTAEEARIVEMLSASVADIARWFGVSPLTLGDLSRGTYSNLAADNAAFYQRSIRPLLDKIELATNDIIFGLDSDVYAEFLTDAILRGDPGQQADIDTKYIQAGVYTRQEVRRWKNLPDVPGLDTPLFPLNQGPALATDTTNGGPQDGATDTGGNAALSA